MSMHGPLVRSGLIALGLTAAGCMGHAAARSPTGRTAVPKTTASTPPRARFTVEYSIGNPARIRSQVDATCPSRATCTTVRLSGWIPPEWIRVVHRRLTCAPAGGDYRHPRAACRALFQIRRLMVRHAPLCSCPAMLTMPARAVGTLDGRRVSVPLDGCSLCGLGQRAAADQRTLMPLA